MSFTILIHSSKTMAVTDPRDKLTVPVFQQQARELSDYVASLSTNEVRTSMHVSEKLAGDVQVLYRHRLDIPPSATVEIFRGDIYSGLRALDWSQKEKEFAQQHLRVLSGLYGILRPYDGITPYRLEAAYKFPLYPNLYEYWGNQLARTIPRADTVINLTSVEYAKLVIPHLRSQRIIVPQFLSIMPNNDEPRFVAVHSKIARGAYARWLIQRGDGKLDHLDQFNDLGYVYDETRSAPDAPVYICSDFKGIGLSQRLA